MSVHITQLYRGEGPQEDRQWRAALIDSVSHELRSPLTSIKLAVGTLMTDGWVQPSKRNELLSIINEEADRLNRLVCDVIDVSQLGANVTLDLGPQRVASIVAAAKEDCRQLLCSRSLSIRLAPGLPAVQADLERARKALVQLLENAIKYSPCPEPITVTAIPNGNFVTISVADRGNGIEDSERELIFQRLYRGKGHRDLIKGTGLGLPIANAIIKAHGGSLTVTSRHGHGSTFSFTLPVYQDRNRWANNAA